MGDIRTITMPPEIGVGVAILAYFWTGQILECTWEDDGCYTRKGALIVDDRGQPVVPIAWQRILQN